LALNKQKRKEIKNLQSTYTVDELAAKYKVSKKEIEEIISSKTEVKKSAKSPYWFYVVLVLIPFIFFFLLELGLRLFNYGDSYEQWVNATPTKLMLNNEVARRYFYTTKSVPYSIQNTFDIDKKADAFRVFIMGESSAAGYPFSPNGSFSRYVQKRLELLYPDKTIEVVNISLTAISSYTLRDLFPGVIEQKPDLVLIYTGHNEYYGALGVGSLESLGQFRFFVNMLLSLNEYRTTQLLREILVSVTSLFSSSADKGETGTLMSRMAKEQLIKYDSNVFKAGLNQFEANMRDILTMAKEANVPVILGTLTSNLKDQPPFNPENIDETKTATDIFNQAKKFLDEGKTSDAKKMFILAKERDALRFRASEKINEIIKKIGNEFNMPIADIDSSFNANSPAKITGDNLMVDHLHPTLDGYWLMGKVFFETMQKSNKIPSGSSLKIPNETQESRAIEIFYFSKLDSTISKYRIIILKNDWPFSSRKDNATMLKLFNAQTTIDSIALFVIDSKYSWEEAHRKAADYYLTLNDFDAYIYEMNVLIDQYPFITEYYNVVAQELLVRKKYNEAYTFLKKRLKVDSDAFSTKWLGIIELSRNNNAEAIRLLKQSISFNNKDAQVFFNLSGAFVNSNDFNSALTAIEKCLQIDNKFPGAVELYNQLSAALKQ
jgi:tetratricopeptide (TPR) repeat protein